MKNLRLLLAMITILGSAFLFTACEDDDLILNTDGEEQPVSPTKED